VTSSGVGFTHSIALAGFSGSSYRPTRTFVSASITPERSKYCRNSSFFFSGLCHDGWAFSGSQVALLCSPWRVLSMAVLGARKECARVYRRTWNWDVTAFTMPAMSPVCEVTNTQHVSRRKPHILALY
jgi:hypothetical protein